MFLMNIKIKKKLTNNIIGLFLLISLLLFFLVNLDIYKKTYNIIKKNVNDRLIEKYGFCSGEGYGFIKYIQNKYNLIQNPTIINYVSYPSPYWILENSSIELNKNEMILINYPDNYYINFEKKNKNEFENSNFVEHSSGIKKINLFFEKIKNTGKIKTKIDIIKLFHNKEELIKTLFIDEEYSNKVSVNVNFTTDKLNSRWEKIIIRIKNDNLDISKVTLDMKNLYDPKLKKIIENQERCYYVKQ